MKDGRCSIRACRLRSRGFSRIIERGPPDRNRHNNGGRMVVTAEYFDVPREGNSMRLLNVAPRAEGRYPGILFYSDIFQLTGPMVRACTRLAGYGFVVAAPEIYNRIEPPGTAIPFDDA